MKKKRKSPDYYLPAEWEPHEATYLAWPNLLEEWSDCYLMLSWIFAEVVRVISQREKVHILCHEEKLCEILSKLFHGLGIELHHRVNFHVVPHSYCWMRDAGPTGVLDKNGDPVWISWGRKQPDQSPFGDSTYIPGFISDLTGWRLKQAVQFNSGKRFHMEGGAFDTDGQGTLLVTEECLLNSRRYHNTEFCKPEYEALFKQYLGIEKVIWLKKGFAEDATKGHVDNVARFVAPGKIVVSLEENPFDPNYGIFLDNFRRLQDETDASGNRLEVIPLPVPELIQIEKTRLPASYANFYLANNLVAVPTFNDRSDYEALGIFRSLFPDRDVIGVHSRELIIAGGALHCLTQQQPHFRFQEQANTRESTALTRNRERM